MIRRSVLLPLIATVFLLAGQFAAQAWSPKPVEDDPLLRLPGTQPNQGVNLEGPNRCLNCHGGYNPAGEPGLQWMGSMMAQAARDPIFWASMVVAEQDSIWRLGNPNAGDLCLRCHMPEGWLGGRSDPTNATLMSGSDFDGLHCDACHRMYDPFFETAHNPSALGFPRESSDWEGYWDEAGNAGPGSGTLSQSEADKTYTEDLTLSQSIAMFNGDPFFAADSQPASPDYTENASGQYFISPNSQKRASFADADARHQMLYSRYHKSKFFCGTCHDVSNPVFANLGTPEGNPLPTETQSAHSYFHVERTFSEFMLSAYGQTGGASTNQEFQNQGAPDISHAGKCQDCHMRDISGRAANKKGAVRRPDESTEHPNSGVPLHDLTGGNAWISYILASLDPNGPNYDAVNAGILDKGPAVLTLDLNAGQSPKTNGAALKAGSDRAKQQLLLAATIKNAPAPIGQRDSVAYEPAGDLSFVIQNNTGHKLITGFPEGRRMFVNIKAYNADGDLIYEVNPYDEGAGTLKGLTYPYNTSLLRAPAELGKDAAGNSIHTQVYRDDLVFEAHQSSSDIDPNKPTFHFVLGDIRLKDNRIPPKGFRIAEAADRQSEPVNPVTHQADTNYFTAAEYAGGYDLVELSIVPGAALVEVTLYYQGTSREYVEFLYNEINGTGNLTLTSPTPSGEPQAYIVQTDPFFAQLKAWGSTIWDLWLHNHGLDGSGVEAPGLVPFAMAQATAGSAEPPPPACDVPGTPTNLVATGAKRKINLNWNAVSPPPTGYTVYYDLAGKLQFADETLNSHYTDTGLKPNNEACYVVKSWNDCEGGQVGTFDESVDQESGPSNVSCATPTRK